jgi:hypothetical protein
MSELKRLLFGAETVRRRILDKSWLEGFVTPDYKEYGISNLPATICKIFGVKSEHGWPLFDQSAKALYEGGRRVVVLLVDSLGYNKLLKTLNEGNSVLSRPSESSVLIPLTSTFPSTTPTALTSLNSGLTPQQHAITGYSLYLKQFGLVANMVNFSPSTENRRDLLREMGLDPSQFMKTNTVFEVLGSAGFHCHVVTRWFFRQSALTSIVHRGAEIETYVDTPDLFITVRRLLEKNPSGDQYIFAYWDSLDIASHVYGPTSEETDAEMRSFLYSLKTELIDRIAPEAAKKTLLLITSDHGGHTLREDRTIEAPDHPELLQCLQIPPTGSSRAPYLYLKAGCGKDVRRFFVENYPDGFMLLDSEEMLMRGLFGLGDVAKETKDRIGDLISLPREGYSLLYPYKPHQEEAQLKGGHGGLSEEEMLVPLLGVPLEKSI